MPKSDETRPATPARNMQKRVEKKDDGRLLIYYTFERSDSSVESASGETSPDRAEGVRK